MTSFKGITVGEGDGTVVHSASLDQRRHRQKIQEAVQNHLVDMVAEDHIVVARGQRTFATKLQRLKECRIRYQDEPGQIGSTQPPSSAEAGDQDALVGGIGDDGGDEAGDLEPSIAMDELVQGLLEYLALPDLDPARWAPGDALEEELQWLSPSTGRWARRETLWANVKRRAYQFQQHVGKIEAQDLRYWQWSTPSRQQGGAVVMALMDTSGSMGNFEKHLAKSFFFWMAEFLRHCYPSLEVVFIAHDVRAHEVAEDAFFHRGTSGGTVSSSAYRLAYDVLEERYPREAYNAYAFHFSDGGNLTSDNPMALEAGVRLQSRVTLFGYGEIHDTERSPSQLFQGFQQRNQRAVLLRSKADLLRSLITFFGESSWHPTRVFADDSG